MAAVGTACYIIRARKESYAIDVAVSSNLFSDAPGITYFKATLRWVCSTANSATFIPLGSSGSVAAPEPEPLPVVMLKKGFRHHLAVSAREMMLRTRKISKEKKSKMDWKLEERMLEMESDTRGKRKLDASTDGRMEAPKRNERREARYERRCLKLKRMEQS